VTGQDSTNLVFTILGFHTIIVIGFHHHCWWSSYHLPGEYGVSASFNVADLSPFDVGDDLRANPSQEGGE
jgi:hypothetical protein